MNDQMNHYDITKELDFWSNYIQPPNDFVHKRFYQDFFDFSILNGKCLEIGCGGSPFITYADNITANIALDLLDPLIHQISNITRYAFLKKYNVYDTGLLDAISIAYKYDCIICLNVLDHFSDSHIDFISRIHNLLNNNGIVFLYYDIREKYSDGHYPVDHNKIHAYIKNKFYITKESLNINPAHRNWSTVYSSYRAVLKIKAD